MIFTLKPKVTTKTDAALNYKIGVCYLFTDNKFLAIDYLKKAFELNMGITNDIHFMLGRAYHLVLDFDKAIEHYSLYKDVPKIKAHEIVEVNKHILECEYGKLLVSNPKRVIINSISKNINSKYDDYNSVFTGDEKTIYFTSRRPESKKAKRSKIDNKFFEDIFYSVNIDNEWQLAERIGIKSLNDKKNKENDAVVGVSPKGDKVYKYKGSKNGGDIFVVQRKIGTKWKKAKTVAKHLNTSHKESGISISEDGKTLFFITNDPKLSIGQGDILYMTKSAKGKWSKPKRLSSSINTKYDELGVQIADSGNTLYFSSKGHNSMGGYDIFMSERNENGTWGQPVNLGYPINTPDDDLFYYSSSNGKYGYFTSIRDQGEGSKDIFKVIYLGAEKEMLFASREDNIIGALKPYPSVFFVVPEAQEIDSTILMRGKVQDINTLDPLTAKIEIIDLNQSKVIATALSSSLGDYKIKIPGGQKYGIEISAPDYLLFLDQVELFPSESQSAVEKDFKLQPIDIGAKVVLENIFFETGKTTLKSESFPAIEQVYKLLNNNPTLRIEISGHTDNTGSYKSNLKLSTERAKSVADYLVQLGVQRSRIEYQGYAYNQPIAPNNTPEGDKKIEG
ncbi:MAG: OmpA family protein [Bacteroidales bacterium]|nr:OmpA family protein [Bacteroidales bacterium]